MENTFDVRVEKSYVWDYCLFILIWLLALVISGILGSKYEMACMILAVCLWVLIEWVKGRGKTSTDVIKVEFREQDFVMEDSRKKRKIRYSDIIEVQKIMVITKTQSDKGAYRLKIKKKGK